jgi:Brp/Blh family beta-carotene 15,15'-monooxygenase
MKRSFAASPETWLFLVLGGVAVALWPGTGAPAAPALLVVLALAVAVTGLPHGALDPWLARRAGLWRTGRGLVVFHLAYVALAALVLVAWRWAPGTSLALFLAISAWHFAGDWRGHLPGWARALAGAALLALPAWRWPGEVREIFMMLSGAEGAAVAGALATMAPWLAAGMAVAAAFALRRSLATAVELAAIATLALLLPPLAYFIVYFCALHSLRHLRHAALGADAGARRRMAGVALAYTLLTLALAALAWPWLAGAGEALPAPGTPLAQLVFIGLAALTLPHMLVVMHAERASGAAP